MILSKTPLRITLGGGGTDLESFYSLYNGFCITAAINKYIYVGLHKSFENNFLLKYSNFEKEKNIRNIKHPIIRKVLELSNINKDFLEIASFADIVGGTGLGSSSCFTVGLLNVINSFKNLKLSKNKLAELACDVEIKKLGLPIGKQDQYASAYGGIKSIKINKQGKVNIKNIKISKKNILVLEKNIGLYFTGKIRKKHNILKKQNFDTKNKNLQIIENLKEIKAMGINNLKLLENGELDKFGKQLHEHWLLKLQRSKNISDSKINKIYNFAINNGAEGGKLIGAGGAGFLMLYSSDQNFLEKKLMKKFNLKKLNFNFDFEGSKIIKI